MKRKPGRLSPNTPYIYAFRDIDMRHLGEVGGKNASLGEMFRNLSSKGVRVPDGFALTSRAYWEFLDANDIRGSLSEALAALDTKQFSNLTDVGKKTRALVAGGRFPDPIRQALFAAYQGLKERYGKEISVAVRSSATAEDLPTASFAGQLESFLNVRSEDELLACCQNCFVSLFNDRAIHYRENNGFQHMETAVSAGVQIMVRSDLASSGVGFTVEPNTGFENAVFLSGSWGLGENVVQGTVTPDQYVLFKPSLRNNKNAILSKKLGAKEMTMVYAPGADLSGKATVNLPTSDEKRKIFCLTEEEAERIGRWALILEKHYGKQMDFEWAKDGLTNEIFLVQARPETVFSQKKKSSRYQQFRLKQKGTPLVQGTGLGKKIASGRARILHSPRDADKLKAGEVLVTEITTPDWDPIMKKAAAIVTDQGGRTSHAAIVARELGIAAVVGAGNATAKILDGEEITISCAEGDTGFVYRGKLDWTVQETDLSGVAMPKTKPMFILGDPDQAFSLASIPNAGVGLMRMEFVITSAIRIHPLALARFEELGEGPEKNQIRILTADYPDKKKYFIDKLAEGVATIAAAFHPKDVIVRMSDFKSNEYASLLGGSGFEPKEENPMLGFRGASRYDHPLYRDGFRLECLAMEKVREELGLENVKLMVPFCRTPEEGKKVIREMAKHGLVQGKKALEIYVMVEIPANVLQAEALAGIFDGFSIGSNDLTQLALGLDRDSTLVAPLFDENNPAVKELITRAVKTAQKKKIKIGLCGQAPSDHPAFARFLVEAGIDSISFSPDAMLQGIRNILAAEKAPHSSRALSKKKRASR